MMWYVKNIIDDDGDDYLFCCFPQFSFLLVVSVVLKVEVRRIFVIPKS